MCYEVTEEKKQVAVQPRAVVKKVIKKKPAAKVRARELVAA